MSVKFPPLPDAAIYSVTDESVNGTPATAALYNTLHDRNDWINQHRHRATSWQSRREATYSRPIVYEENSGDNIELHGGTTLSTLGEHVELASFLLPSLGNDSNQIEIAIYIDAMATSGGLRYQYQLGRYHWYRGPIQNLTLVGINGATVSSGIPTSTGWFAATITLPDGNPSSNEQWFLRVLALSTDTHDQRPECIMVCHKPRTLSGTAKSGGGSTTTVGGSTSTVLQLTDATGFAAGDHVQVNGSEVALIKSVAAPAITLTSELLGGAPGAGVTVVEVNAYATMADSTTIPANETIPALANYNAADRPDDVYSIRQVRRSQGYIVDRHPRTLAARSLVEGLVVDTTNPPNNSPQAYKWRVYRGYRVSACTAYVYAGKTGGNGTIQFDVDGTGAPTISAITVNSAGGWFSTSLPASVFSADTAHVITMTVTANASAGDTVSVEAVCIDEDSYTTVVTHGDLPGQFIRREHMEHTAGDPIVADWDSGTYTRFDDRETLCYNTRWHVAYRSARLLSDQLGPSGSTIDWATKVGGSSAVVARWKTTGTSGVAGHKITARVMVETGDADGNVRPGLLVYKDGSLVTTLGNQGLIAVPAREDWRWFELGIVPWDGTTAYWHIEAVWFGEDTSLASRVHVDGLRIEDVPTALDPT